jgi:hypothetical protein
VICLPAVRTRVRTFKNSNVVLPSSLPNSYNEVKTCMLVAKIRKRDQLNIAKGLGFAWAIVESI